jgi:hypothetical protein
VLIETPLLAAQGVAESAGAASTGGVLSGAAPEMLAVMPMGGEEVSMMLAQAIAAHNAQFLAATGVGVAQRAAFAGTVASSAAAYTVMNGVSQALVSLT